MRKIPLRLGVRPSRHPALSGFMKAGEHRIPRAPHGIRESLLRVPGGVRFDQPVPLAVVLHGSGGQPRHALEYLEPYASGQGVLLVAPPSLEYTWDAILGRGGHDAEAVNHALQWVFERFLVDPARIAVAGFSDGASYALALGLANADVFGATVALSPGFIPHAEPFGPTRVFVSHGTQDAVLPIERCSRRLVPLLRDAGVDVTYEEFEGGHLVPPEVARRACGWMLRG
jgi:predicted esterase